MPRTNNELFLTLILSGIATIFEQYGLIWFLVVCALLMESITFYIASKAKGHKIRTNKKRILRVVSQILSILFGLLLDALEGYLVARGNEVLGITFKSSIPFGVIICVYIILTESIDILNNLNTSGAHFPPIVLHLLKNLKEKICEMDLPTSDTPTSSEISSATPDTSMKFKSHVEVASIGEVPFRAQNELPVVKIGEESLASSTEAVAHKEDIADKDAPTTHEKNNNTLRQSAPGRTPKAKTCQPKPKVKSTDGEHLANGSNRSNEEGKNKDA